MATWATLIALLSVHLGTNYAAVKSVNMRSLNRQRANIVLSNILQDGRILSPTEVSKRERVFEREGVLRWADDGIIGHCRIGVTMQTMLGHMGPRHERTGSLDLQAIKLSDLMRLYEYETYILWFAPTEALIVLKQGCTPIDQLKAWTQALLLVRREWVKASDRKPDTSGERFAELRSTVEETAKVFDTYAAQLRDVGWDLDVAALETRAGKRIETNKKA